MGGVPSHFLSKLLICQPKVIQHLTGVWKALALFKASGGIAIAAVAQEVRSWC
jgi:hypothetical protein